MLFVFIRGCFLRASPSRAKSNHYVEVRKAMSMSHSTLSKSFSKHQCRILKPLVSETLCILSSRRSLFSPFKLNYIFCFPGEKHSKSAKRFLSYSTEQISRLDKKVDNVNNDIDLDKDASDLKSILEDIKNDFSDTKNTETSESLLPEKNNQKRSEKKSSTEPEQIPTTLTLCSEDQLKESEQSTSVFQYDYRVAEDIEEYEYKDEREMAQQMVRPEKVLPISLTRGQTGVFDLEELLVFLNHLGAENIVTIPIPYEANFCDYMVISSAKSKRHLSAMNEEFLWVHKRKKSDVDAHLNIEGFGKSDWSALDLGNIVLHIFYGEAREHYDIESLWTLGPENDPKCKEQNEDLSALSAENLFWLETAKKTGTDDKLDNKQESEAGCGNPKTS